MKAAPRKTGPLKVRQPSETVGEYLAAVRPDGRAALLKLRKAIKGTAPEATESISYQVPTFKKDGRPLVAYGAAATHCTFYVMSTGVVRAYASELKGYELGKGSIQFLPDAPLPAALVAKLVKARLAENKERG